MNTTFKILALAAAAEAVRLQEDPASTTPMAEVPFEAPVAEQEFLLTPFVNYNHDRMANPLADLNPDKTNSYQEQCKGDKAVASNQYCVSLYTGENCTGESWVYVAHDDTDSHLLPASHAGKVKSFYMPKPMYMQVWPKKLGGDQSVLLYKGMPNAEDVLNKNVLVRELDPAADREWCTNLKEVDTGSYRVKASNMCEYVYLREKMLDGQCPVEQEKKSAAQLEEEAAVKKEMEEAAVEEEKAAAEEEKKEAAALEQDLLESAKEHAVTDVAAKEAAEAVSAAAAEEAAEAVPDAATATEPVAAAPTAAAEPL